MTQCHSLNPGALLQHGEPLKFQQKRKKTRKKGVMEHFSLIRQTFEGGLGIYKFS